MNAKKCDKCGQFYEAKQLERIAILIHEKYDGEHFKHRSIDLCNECT